MCAKYENYTYRRTPSLPSMVLATHPININAFRRILRDIHHHMRIPKNLARAGNYPCAHFETTQIIKGMYRYSQPAPPTGHYSGMALILGFADDLRRKSPPRPGRRKLTVLSILSTDHYPRVTHDALGQTSLQECRRVPTVFRSDLKFAGVKRSWGRGGRQITIVKAKPN